VTEENAPDATGATKREGQGSSARRHLTEPQAVPELTRGTLVGRYVILDVLGEGGMGVVYAAFDPELDRKVAVKLLQASQGGSESGGQAWLMREAQAMARLSHPNVIAVHDVGTLSGDRVFVAMELVDGGTLRTWIEGDHSWREVVAVMRAAGEGLAAAHAAGLVHRDLKPDNVLVGKDGRVRVMDFGLARLGGAARDSDLSIDSRSPLSEKLTVAGTVVGTPAYMAPELYAGTGADDKTDQFAFGVTLYEALYRKRPYDKRELAAKDAAPKMKPVPAKTDVPARVQRVVARAIAIDPAARFPSMAALLAELAVDPTAARKRAALAVGAVVVLGGLVAGGYAVTRADNEVCKGFDRRLAGAWDPATKQTIESAFAATKHVRAAEAFGAVSHALDRYTNEWTSMAVGSCEATRKHRDQTESDMALRSDCLDSRLAELRALTALFAKPDSDTVDKAEKAALGLDPIAGCANLPMLRAPDAPPPGARESLIKFSDMIAQVKAAVLANKIGAAITNADAALALAKKINWDPALAEAYMLHGTSQFAGGNPFDSIEDLIQASMAAIRGRRDDVLADAALFCATAASQTRKDDVARTWLAVGIAASSRITGDRALESRRYQTEGIVLARSGDSKGAIAADEKALAIATELYGKYGGLAVAQAEQELASAYASNLEYVKALPHLETALMLLDRVEGPEHPDSATGLGTLAMIYAHTGDIAKARANFEKAIDIREKVLGKNSPSLVPSLNNIADMLYKSGDPEHALIYIERALPIAEKFGKTNAMYLTIKTTYGEILSAAGRQAEARKLFDELLAAEDQSHSSVLGQTLTSRAQAEVRAAKWADAASFAERAVTVIEASSGKEAPALWPPLASLAEARANLGKRDEAKKLFDRAFSIAKAAQTSDSDLADAKAAYAKLK
jgi:tetratricopeptide (TPR) repeat protein